MVKFTGFSVLLAAIASVNVVTCSTGIRGNNDNFRRHLIADDSECVLYMRDTQYEDHTREDERWACEFTREQAQRFGGQDIIEIEGLSEEMIKSRGIVSGHSVMKTKGAYVEQALGLKNDMKMVIPKEATVSFRELFKSDPRHPFQRRRNLASSQPGTLRTLVVRVIDSAGNQPDADAAQLKDDIFTDSVSLKTQMAACSKDQLIIEPASDVGDGGIVNVEIDMNASEGSDSIEAAARTKAEALYGGNEGLASRFDLVMFCQPPGSGDWLAFAYINRWDSFYNNKWCQQVSAQMHEIGHNFGLGHSGKGNEDYGDVSSMMGYSWDEDDGPSMCFNAAKNYQLGWYDQQKASVNPLDFTFNPQTFVLNGIDDYKKDGSSNGELITLRLEQYGANNGLDYYIGYNRKSGANSGTYAAADQVVVFEKPTGGPNGYSKSKRIADLSEGDTFTISNFKNTIYDVYITVQSISADMKDATIVISTSDPYPTQAPTESCGTNAAGRFKLELRTDEYGFETSWELRSTDGTVIAEGTDDYASKSTYSFPGNGASYCLEEGSCYELEMRDSWGDGMCCQYGEGYYRGILDGKVIFEGGQMSEKSEIVSFCVEEGVATPSPTPVPTEAPTEIVLGECDDDPDFRFKGEDTKSCKWVGRGKNNLSKKKNRRRIKKRCKKYQLEDDGVTQTRLWDYCPATCALVDLGPCAR